LGGGWGGKGNHFSEIKGWLALQEGCLGQKPLFLNLGLWNPGLLISGGKIRPELVGGRGKGFTGHGTELKGKEKLGRPGFQGSWLLERGSPGIGNNLKTQKRLFPLNGLFLGRIKTKTQERKLANSGELNSGSSFPGNPNGVGLLISQALPLFILRGWAWSHRKRVSLRSTFGGLPWGPRKRGRSFELLPRNFPGRFAHPAQWAQRLT